MHYAVVKCERVQVEWFYRGKCDNSYWKDSSYKYLMKYIKANESFSKSHYQSSLYDYEKHWMERIEQNKVERYFREEYIKNGQCNLWEGEVNQERLRITDKLYIPNIEEYLSITDVETTPDGKITYYVKYIKRFYDTHEQSRLKQIEKWIDSEYPDSDSFEDLKVYKDVSNEDREDYEKYLKYKEELLNGNSNGNTQLKTSKVGKNIYLKKSEDNVEDEKWENVTVIGGIVFLTLFCILLMLVFLR